MRAFTYQSAGSAQAAVGGTSDKPGSSDKRGDGATVFLAGGTTLLDLMKLDVSRPAALIDIGEATQQLSVIEATAAGLRIGALAKMSAVANDTAVNRDYPVVAQSLQMAASAQLRNMASMAGNLLQRTRCSYFRDTTWARCNKRVPGSGCDALEGMNRLHGVLAVSEQCIASYPGDFANVFVALDGSVEVLGPRGARTIRAANLHLASGDSPAVETTLHPGELITALYIPSGPHTRRSAYVKVRDRQSYAFALTSAAVAMDLQGGTVRDVRIGLGGVAGKPWRSAEAEAVLRGQPFSEALASRAGEAAFARARTREHNAFKPQLGALTLVRALMQVHGMEV
ncbi:MAG: xanthine dehydrogenase family protein subunit M [Anaerolineae bacterium]|nr:xanthine dehydrogenase family protein subunit M [Gloeobacterales cyanobacterium ES-bin-313]